MTFFEVCLAAYMALMGFGAVVFSGFFRSRDMNFPSLLGFDDDYSDETPKVPQTPARIAESSKLVEAPGGLAGIPLGWQFAGFFLVSLGISFGITLGLSPASQFLTHIPAPKPYFPDCLETSGIRLSQRFRA